MLTDAKAYKSASIIASIPSSHLSAFSYTHSFFMTENYIVFAEQPLVVNGFKLATCTAKGKPLTECLEWNQKDPTRFHIIRKSTGAVRTEKYHSDAFYFFHTINAFEDGDYLILDVVAYDDASVLDKYAISKLRKNEWDNTCPPVPKRFVIPLGKLEVNN